MSKVHVKLKNIPGHATCEGEPSKELLDAINKMAELAYSSRTLRPCPLCGARALIGGNGMGQHIVKCIPCGLSLSQDREDKAICIWNQRTH